MLHDIVEAVEGEPGADASEYIPLIQRGGGVSCLGVCYANDPQKGGVYDARACA